MHGNMLESRLRKARPNSISWGASVAPGPAHRCASFSHTRSCTYEWRSGCTVVDKICMPRNWKKLQPRQLIAGEVAISFSFSVSCMPCTVGVRLPLRLDGKGQKSKSSQSRGNRKPEAHTNQLPHASPEVDFVQILQHDWQHCFYKCAHWAAHAHATSSPLNGMVLVIQDVDNAHISHMPARLLPEVERLVEAK